MSRIIKCDRCGAEISKQEQAGYISIMQREQDTTLTGVNPFEDKDFCQKCCGEIADFINKVKPARKPKKRGGG